MNSKRNNNNNRRKRIRNKRVNKLFKATEYADSTLPQRYGPGKLIVNIDFNLSISSSRQFKLGDLLNTSVEYQKYAMQFNYYKVVSIVVIFSPNNVNLTGEYFKIQLNWENNQDVAYIEYEDNSKNVPMYRTHRYVYRFLLPNMTYLVGVPSTTDVSTLSIINPSEYTRTYIPVSYYPGRLLFSDRATQGTNCRLIMRMQFRGSKIPNNASLHKLSNMLESVNPKEGIKYQTDLGHQEDVIDKVQ